MKKQEVFLYILLIASFAFACFTPGDITFTRLENFVLPLVLVSMVALPKVKIPSGMVLVMLIYFSLTILTNIMNSLGFSAYMFAFRTIKYLLLFLFAANIYNSDFRIIDQTIKVVVLLTTFVVIIQLINPFGLADSIHSFYTSRSQDEFLVNDSRRILGVMKNPNDNAVFLLCLSAYFMSSYYYFKNKSDIYFMIVCAGIIVLAQSRTTLIALGIMYIVLVLQYKLNWKLVIGVFSIILLSVISMYFLKMNYLMELITDDPLDIPAFRGRFAAWNYMLEAWKGNEFFGIGPFADQMDEHRNAPDNEYLYVMACNGVVGLISFVAVIVYPIIVFWKHKKCTHALIAILIPVAFLFIAITNFTILNIRIGLIYFILLAIPFSELLKDEYNYKRKWELKGLGFMNISNK